MLYLLMAQQRPNYRPVLCYSCAVLLYSLGINLGFPGGNIVCDYVCVF